jgi:DNA polymerase I-like protein with 3'-5' exonuclease and polymerase domains
MKPTDAGKPSPRSLRIWTTDSKSKVLKTLAPVLHLQPDVQIAISAPGPVDPDNPEVILSLGTGGIDFLAEHKIIPKGRKITSLRGKPWPMSTSSVLFSYSAGILDIDYGWHVDLLCDARLALRFAATGEYESPAEKRAANGQYRYVDRFTDLRRIIEQDYAKTGKPVPLAFDTETVGVDPYAPGVWVVSLQFSVGPHAGFADVVHFHAKHRMEEWMQDWQNMEDLQFLLTSPKVTLRMANGKFDAHWMWVHFGIRLGACFKFDTTLVGSLLDENRSNALDVHAKIYTDLGGYSDVFDSTVDKSRMDLVPPEKLLPYAAGDTDATLQAADAMKDELKKDPQLTNFYVHLLHPTARAYEMVEQAGVCVDKEAYAELKADLETSMVDSVAKIKRLVGGRIVAKHWKDDKELNPTKPTFLIDFMFSPMGLNLKPKMKTEKTKEPSTSIEHLLMFKEDPKAKPFIDLIEEYRSAAKTHSTYVVGFLSHLRSDGRFHPSYFLHRGNKDEGEGGTNTGRLSCRDPAFQTIPKHTVWGKRLRKCYIAPPGMVILSFDYSQGELRVIACLADETNMLAAYQQGMDLHSLTAGTFRGYTYEQMMAMKGSEDPAQQELFEAIRQLGKAGNFGLIYGMGEDGFGDYAHSNYGVQLTQQEVADFRNGFFARYPRLLEYHAAYKAHAKQHGYVRTPLGRVRHLPLIKSPRNEISSKAERQAINAPVQATLSDMSLLCTAEMYKRGWMEWAPQFGMVHDQNLIYCPEDRVLQHAKDLKELAENLPFDKFGWEPQLTFVADTTYGPNLADQTKIK